MKKITSRILIVGAPLIFITGLFTQALADKCAMGHIIQRAAVKELVQEDAYLQWLQWEQTANLEKFRQPKEAAELPLSVVPLEKVEIQADPSVSKLAQQIFLQVYGKDHVLWAKHPFNSYSVVPFFSKTEVGNVQAYYTASRSMALTGNLRGFTIKMPTDHPHGPHRGSQPSKADTSADVASALLHTEHIISQDKKLKPDEVLIILPEVLTVAEKETNIGYVVRDVRKTDDGHYYLPALSIPYVGREIAKINGQPFEKFWEEHYAKLLGEAKARLLLRYGLQMETPNPQNMLIQLDRNLKPTGRIAFRDMSDAFFVDDIAQALGFKKAVEKDMEADYDPHEYIQPFVSNSLWRLDEAGPLSVSSNAMTRWSIVHNRQFTMHILKELKLKNIPLLQNNTNDKLEDLYKFLLSPEGLEKLKKYSEDPERQKEVERPYWKAG